jgi:radical SAM protein with 4Fe4S-binding SPASM domain
MCVVTFDWEENDAEVKFKNFDRKRTLSWVVIEVTGSCNFNCKWCFANSTRSRESSHMEIGSLKKLLAYLAGNGVRQVTFSGGEPTIYPHLDEAVKTASEFGMTVHMNTNGFLLSRERARELASLGLTQVQINIDSLDYRKHDEVRGMEGSFRRAILALANARREGITCVSQTVLTRENESEIADIFRFARTLGIQRCRIWDMTPSEGRAQENGHMMSGRYIEVLQQLSDLAYSTGAKKVEVGEPLFLPNVRTELRVTGGYCVAAAGLYSTISKEGGVFPCATLRHPMYNIFDCIENGLDLGKRHIEALASYIRTFKTPGTCQGCGFLGKCMGGCFTRRRHDISNRDYLCKPKVHIPVQNF